MRLFVGLLYEFHECRNHHLLICIVTDWMISNKLLPPVTVVPFIKAAKSREWLLSGKRNYLLQFYKVNGELVESENHIKTARLSAKEDDDDDYMCVEDMVLDCWHRNKVLQNDLEEIITNFAT